jgi:hypothetical protein
VKSWQAVFVVIETAFRNLPACLFKISAIPLSRMYNAEPMTSVVIRIIGSDSLYLSSVFLSSNKG